MNKPLILEEIESASLQIKTLQERISSLQTFIAIKTAELQGVSSMPGAEARLMMLGSPTPRQHRVYGDGKRGAA